MKTRYLVMIVLIGFFMFFISDFYFAEFQFVSTRVDDFDVIDEVIEEPEDEIEEEPEEPIKSNYIELEDGTIVTGDFEYLEFIDSLTERVHTDWGGAIYMVPIYMVIILHMQRTLLMK